MIEDKTFLLGIGAQKAGTTWLHNYLNGRDEIFMHPLKEVHFFDAKYRKDLCGYFDQHFSKRLRERVKNLNQNQILNDLNFEALMYRVLMSKNDFLYEHYFEIKVTDKHKYYGEITPAYSLLSKESFLEIKKKYPRIKIIFLMRDPIERHLSAYKMECKLLDKVCDFDSIEFDESLRNAVHIERTDYKRIVSDLEEIFDSEDLFFGFYETLFTNKEIKKLCHFLQIEFKPGNYSNRINFSKTNAKTSDTSIIKTHNVYKNIYEFCHNRFRNTIPDSWSK